MKNVVVTGMGVLSVAGYNLDSFWNTLCEGNLCYTELSEMKQNNNYRIKIGAKIIDTKWNHNIEEEFLRYGKCTQYCISTAKRALQDAALELSSISPERIAVVIGTTMGEIETEEQITKRLCRKEAVKKELYQNYSTYNIVFGLAQAIGARGFLYAVPAACAAGNYAVAIGKNLLDWNCADVVIAGGVDAFSYVAFAGFQRLLSLTSDVCRPFDKNRKGLVVGEGCGILVMEREGERDYSKQYGRILGSGLTTNAYHMTAPHCDGAGELAAMRNALENARLKKEDISYISAHGTGTRLNDKMECQIIKALFGENSPPTSSIKSMIGHSMGAASILELVASYLMIQKQILLPTMNYETKDELCDLDVVANSSRKANIKTILSNSFAFGGQSSCIIIGE